MDINVWSVFANVGLNVGVQAFMFYSVIVSVLSFLAFLGWEIFGETAWEMIEDIGFEKSVALVEVRLIEKAVRRSQRRKQELEAVSLWDINMAILSREVQKMNAGMDVKFQT